MTAWRGPDAHRVVVCGSNYGRVYLEAIDAADGFRAEGLLARGSARSQRLAERHGLVLHDSAAELEGRYDVACCALPSSADEVVLELLDRGLHVLCEHPRSPQLVATACQRAARSLVVAACAAGSCPWTRISLAMSSIDWPGENTSSCVKCWLWSNRSRASSIRPSATRARASVVRQRIDCG